MSQAPVLSCVSTLYRSSPFVAEFVARIAAAAKTIASEFEIILVDDGSPDDSKDIAVSLQDQFPQLRIIELSRNFGHHPAILAGLSESRGEFVFFIDSDLEEAPELLLDFWSQIDGLDVVFGVHDREGKTAFHKFTGSLFWSVMRFASNVNIVRNLANVRLMRRGYVEALLAMPDRNIFLGGMFAWPGFRQTAVNIKRKERADTSYSIGARLRLATVAAISFSNRPLFMVFGLGLIITFFALLTAFFLVVGKLLNPGTVLSGFTSIMVSIWLLGGLLMGSVGIVGFYVAHIYEQSRNRPLYIVRKRYEVDR
ncbi:glycosyltransferase family 2 protein [Nitrobacter sp.]|uniref:glycosyltransferase family 2 protein n=1 Tax=Nitrobacter sp. TaxID=29420 RepID=UPI0029CAAC57|nr:glycosyltransferase family 2 protein [Nitrobacter sp.]